MEDKRETEPLQSRSYESDSTLSTRWGPLLTTVGIVTTLGTAIPVGYNIGVINSPAIYMKSWCNETLHRQYDVVMEEQGLDLLWASVVSIFLVGGAIGSLGGSFMADRFGRKGCYIISCALFIIAAIFFQFCRLANSVEMLLIGRLIVGFASGLTTAVLPIYHTELASLSLRGTLGVFCSMGVTGGVVVGQVFSLHSVLGSEDLWHYGLSCYAILSIVCCIPVFMFPESPKYLYIIKAKPEKAKKEIQKLRCNNEALVKEELDDLEIYSNTKVESRSFWSIITDKKLFLPILIVSFYQGGQQLSGINAVFYYSVSIFQNIGLTKSEAEWGNLGCGVLNLCVAALGPLLMIKINRRPLMMTSCGASALFLVILTISIVVVDTVSWYPVLCVVCVLGYIFFYQIGLGPIPYFIGSELVEVIPRPTVMALGSLSSWLCNFIIGMTFPIGDKMLGAYIFLLFAFDCVVLLLLTKFYVPETRGKNPTAVSLLIADGLCSKPNSS